MFKRKRILRYSTQAVTPSLQLNHVQAKTSASLIFSQLLVVATQPCSSENYDIDAIFDCSLELQLNHVQAKTTSNQRMLRLINLVATQPCSSENFDDAVESIQKLKLQLNHVQAKTFFMNECLIFVIRCNSTMFKRKHVRLTRKMTIIMEVATQPCSSENSHSLETYPSLKSVATQPCSSENSTNNSRSLISFVVATQPCSSENYNLMVIESEVQVSCNSTMFKRKRPLDTQHR